MSSTLPAPDRTGADWPSVDSVDALVALLGEPTARARDKGRDRLLEVDRDWLAAAPFCVLSTADATGRCDASPKGDPAGMLTHVLDDQNGRATGGPTGTATSCRTPTSGCCSSSRAGATRCG